jgi:CheY-like chemotaxis protein
MPPGVLERIFEPFFTTKPPGEGSGLGMAMVYGLMKQHGGFVDVQSAPGAGTTVTLYFPAAVDRPRMPAPAPPATKAAGGTILLVEDEPALRRAGQRLLERHGYRVLVAADGEEGLQLARAHRHEIALIFSDVVMPRLSGSAMHAALISEGITLPFLFTSGYTGREMPDGVPLPLGVPLLPKPWDAHELAIAVAKAIDGGPTLFHS